MKKQNVIYWLSLVLVASIVVTLTMKISHKNEFNNRSRLEHKREAIEGVLSDYGYLIRNDSVLNSKDNTIMCLLLKEYNKTCDSINNQE